MRLGYCYEIKTPLGIECASLDCEIECDLCPNGQPSINGVFVGKEDLFDGDILHRSLACAIAGEAENSTWVLNTLREAAEEERMERAYA